MLVADDDDDVRDAIREVLENRRYHVIVARTGRDALRALSVVQVALVLLDLSMPEMDGWEFLRRKAADLTIAALPVVVVTAMANPHAVMAEAAVVGVLRKPLVTHELLEIVRRYVAGPGSQRGAWLRSVE